MLFNFKSLLAVVSLLSVAGLAIATPEPQGDHGRNDRRPGNAAAAPPAAAAAPAAAPPAAAAPPPDLVTGLLDAVLGGL